jgi:hypothetical protein
MWHLQKVLLALLVLTAPLDAQERAVEERLDLAALQRIREEGFNRSQVDSLAGYLTDVVGPRLTGSPGLARAQRWAMERFSAWGLTRARLEPWDSLFGRGWERVSYSGRFLEPFVQPLRAEPQAWSGSTPGKITCPVVALPEFRDTTEMAQYRGRFRGACVLRSAFRDIGPEFTLSPRRIDAETLLALARRPPERQLGAAQGAPRRQPPQRTGVPAGRVLEWLRTEQPAAILTPSSWTYGLIRAQGHPDGRIARDSSYDPVPALMVTHEQYGQMWRNTRRGVPVRLELEVQTRFLDERGAANVVAEIPGSVHPNEIVLIGAHFDSWHGGTGATDNAAGSVVMMEAMRILRSVNLPLRRTVRVALWSGEEQGLLGSEAYVRTHREEIARTVAYLNMDTGTGRLRGAETQGNAEVAAIADRIFEPLRDLGLVASNTSRSSGSDHVSFRDAGVAVLDFIQDPIEYFSRSWHSHVDTYERLLIEDLKQAAVAVAWTAYTLANRDQPLPRGDSPRPAAGN